jgi:hypothetical protein
VAGIDERIALVEEFKQILTEWERDRSDKKREWLNQNMHSVRREAIEANTHINMTISPPPAVGGLVMRIDPFVHMFDRPWKAPWGHTTPRKFVLA